MKIIALLPVRNEAWVLPHSLACLSAFCDVVLVNDQNSEDESREICRRFPKVVLIESSEQLDLRAGAVAAARRGARLRRLQPAVVHRRGRADVAGRWRADSSTPAATTLKPGTVVECLLLPSVAPRRSLPHRRAARTRRTGRSSGCVDDRHMDFGRDAAAAAARAARAAGWRDRHGSRPPDLPVLHLQWLIAERNQMKQAWYRCREWLDGVEDGRRDQRVLRGNPSRSRRPHRGGAGRMGRGRHVSGPRGRSRAVVAGARHPAAGSTRTTPEFFEPLEIWHIRLLRDEFRRRVGRSPRPDRSYLPSWPERARRFGRRVVGAARRRLPV